MDPGIDLTFDCTDAEQQATFWKTALGYEDEPAPPPFASRDEWFDHHGVPPEERSGGAWLRDPHGRGPRIAFLAVPEPKTAKNRLHLDLRVAGEGPPDECWGRITAEVERLKAAGARPLEFVDGHHVVMADPEGNEFCVA
jgi:catechol 2,3-dioxygenase-like lactoylglutathione lyase family enzyme